MAVRPVGGAAGRSGPGRPGGAVGPRTGVLWLFRGCCGRVAGGADRAGWIRWCVFLFAAVRILSENFMLLVCPVRVSGSPLK